MLERRSAAEQILEAVSIHPECTLDELTDYLDALTWSEVFLEVDQLSRSGHLLLTQSGSGFVTTIRVR